MNLSITELWIVAGIALALIGWILVEIFWAKKEVIPDEYESMFKDE